MVRGLIFGGIAFAAAYAAATQLDMIRKDIKKYDSMSTMSGSPTLAQRVFTTVLNALGQSAAARERQTRDFIESLVGDVIRYARIKGM